MSRQCFECEAVGPLHDHHVVPRSRGGTKTVPLCERCHGMAHHRDRNMTTSRLAAEAMARMAENGEYTGGHPPYGWALADDGSLVANDAEQEAIWAAKMSYAKGLSLRKVGAMLASRGLAPRSGEWHPQKVKSLLAARCASLVQLTLFNGAR